MPLARAAERRAELPPGKRGLLNDAAYFREEALHCRELAVTATDLETQAALVALADDYLQRAREIDEAEC
jgi:hypothetical protein